MEFETVLVNLKVLKWLGADVRLNTTQTLFRIHSPSSWVPASVQRWWHHQSRVTDIARIQNLYKDALGFVHARHPHAERLKQYMADSRKGLLNLKTTYRNDPTALASLELVLDAVSATLDE